MNQEDPLHLFFPGQESVDLYDVLSINQDAAADEIRRAYRRAALSCHPDKHATATETVKLDASVKFQQIGFAYAVLSDEKRRKRYDATGSTDEGFELAAGDDGWEAYFEAMFERVTRGKLDEMKKEYQGSSEEIEDLKDAYVRTSGSIAEMMTFIPHSTHEDEARFIVIISELISNGHLTSNALWESSTRDEKSKLVRQKQGQKEAKEAEKLAKELGVWDEFYGSGKTTKRDRKDKGKKKDDGGEDDEDHSALQALILKKRKNADGFFDSLAAKYAESGSSKTPRGKGKKRGKATGEDEDNEPLKKKSRVSPPPDISDKEFEALQEKLFGEKATIAPASKRKKSGKGNKTK